MTFGNGLPLPELMAEARRSSAEAVCGRLGEWHLIVDTTELGESAESLSTASSVRVSTPRGSTIVSVEAGVAFPLVRKPTSTFDFIAVGRNEGNDIWLPHASVSRFHAYFRRVASGLVALDARSENGTFVDDVRIAPRESDPGPALAPGQLLRFGDVEATLLGPVELARLLGGGS